MLFVLLFVAEWILWEMWVQVFRRIQYFGIEKRRLLHMAHLMLCVVPQYQARRCLAHQSADVECL